MKNHQLDAKVCVTFRTYNKFNKIIIIIIKVNEKCKVSKILGCVLVSTKAYLFYCECEMINTLFYSLEIWWCIHTISFITARIIYPFLPEG